MQKNIRAEKERRKLAQEEGIHRPIDKSEFASSTRFLSPEQKAVLVWKRFSRSSKNYNVDFIGAYLKKQMPAQEATNNSAMAMAPCTQQIHGVFKASSG